VEYYTYTIKYICNSTLDIAARLCQTEQLGLIKNGTQSISNSKPNSTSSFLFSCPKPEDPLHFTECCDSVTEGHQGSYCCEKRAHEFISGLDDRYLKTLNFKFHSYKHICALIGILMVLKLPIWSQDIDSCINWSHHSLFTLLHDCTYLLFLEQMSHVLNLQE